MEIIITFIENLLLSLGLEGTTVAIVRYVLMIVIAFLLAGLSGYICRKFIVPLIIKFTSKTST